MKKAFTLLLLAVAACAKKVTWKDLMSREYTFEEYMHSHSKTYAGEKERAMRRVIFEQNLLKIRHHNKQNLSWKMGVNQFTDMKQDELDSYNGLKMNRPAYDLKQTKGSLPFELKEVSELPTDVDWRENGVVTPTKDQGACGSCWTFAAAETIESHLALSTGVLVELSEQELVSCMPNPKQCGGTGGCYGATSELAFEYVQNNGMPSEWTYSYTSHDGTEPKCINATKPMANIGGYVRLEENQYKDLMNAIAQVGPLAISVDAGAWSTYESGVFDGCNTTNPDINHAVQLVGYGTDNELGDYWLVRNSWTPTWGEGGFIRVKRRSDEDNHCGTDITPFDGTACKGDPDTVKVCGTCGILFDSSYPTGVTLV